MIRNYKDEEVCKDAYKIMCQLSTKVQNKEVIDRALSFAVATGEHHVVIELLRSNPELYNKEPALAELAKSVISSRVDDPSISYLKAIVRGIETSKEFNRVHGHRFERGLLKLIAEKNFELEAYSNSEKWINITLNMAKAEVDKLRKTRDFTTLSRRAYEQADEKVKKAEADYLEKQQKYENYEMNKCILDGIRVKNNVLSNYSEVEKGYVDASNKLSSSRGRINDPVSGLMNWAYSQLALRDIGIVQPENETMGLLKKVAGSEPDNWQVKWAVLELKKARPYWQNVREEFSDPSRFTKEDKVEMENLSDEANEVIEKGSFIRSCFAGESCM